MLMLEKLLMALARRGRIECRDCGEFHKKGQPCRCHRRHRGMLQ